MDANSAAIYILSSSLQYYYWNVVIIWPYGSDMGGGIRIAYNIDYEFIIIRLQTYMSRE